MSQQPSVLLIGAGELGLAILQALFRHPAQNGGKVTILLRQSTIDTNDTAKKEEIAYLRSLGATLEPGDVAQQSSTELAQVFKRYHTVIGCSGMALPNGSQLKISQAVIEAGVSRYIPWQFGVDYDIIGSGSSQDLFDEQLQVRALLRSQTKTNWIIISTGIFMSFLFIPEFGAVDLEHHVLRGLGSWKNRATATTPKDIGIMTAEVVYVPKNIVNQIVYIAGDTVSWESLADMVEGCYGVAFHREVWDLELLQKSLVKGPKDTFHKYQCVWGEGRGVAWDMDKTLNVERGIQLENVKSYLERVFKP